MKHAALLLCLAFPLILALTIAGCAEPPGGGSSSTAAPDLFTPAASNASDPRANQVRVSFIETVDTLAARLGALKQAAASPHGDAAARQRMQEAFDRARRAYKRIEYLAAHQYPQAAERINGAALPEVEPDDQRRRVHPPEGFQVIEELIFPAPDLSARAQLLSEIAVLQANVERVRQYAAQNAFTDRHVWEALQQEMICLVSLGLSGFDSPIALRSLPEAAAALRGMKLALQPYASDLKKKDAALASGLSEKMEAAAAVLTAPSADFEAFDRLGFLTDYANPISRMLYEAKRALGVPHAPVAKAQRPDAATIYDADAFNPVFFAPAGAAEATPAQIELGRLLFYEPALSGSGTRSCATCHQPGKAFTDGRPRSLALAAEGEGPKEPDPHAALRNAPTLLNAGLQGASAYDLRTQFLEDRITAALTGAREMNGSYEEAAGRLCHSPGYVRRLREAFGTVGGDAALGRHLQTALTAYTRSLQSMNSDFDHYVRGEAAALSAAAQRGFNLFMGKALCGTCHFAPLFNGTVPPRYAEAEAEVLGVPTAPDTAGATIDPDVGRYVTYEIDLDRFAFKTPTVRNAAVTAPYMHNGAYETLEQVIDFYDRGGGAGIGIDLAHQTLPPEPLNLTDQEKADLVAFMRALTDTSSIAPPPAHLPALTGDASERRSVTKASF